MISLVTMGGTWWSKLGKFGRRRNGPPSALRVLEKRRGLPKARSGGGFLAASDSNSERRQSRPVRETQVDARCQYGHQCRQGRRVLKGMLVMID